MAFAKKGVRVFLPRRGSEGTGLKMGRRSEIAVGVGCRGKEGCEEGERRMGRLLGFLMEMRLPPPPVASSWHVPLNLNAFAPLDDDARINVTR